MADDSTVDLGIAGLGPAIRIGSGGFADVYRAQQTNLRRDVAVKVLRAAAGDAQVRMRFERECHALGAVSGHPNIVALHEGGFTDDGRAYLVMEFCPSGSLLDQLQANGALSTQEVTGIAAKIARALGVAHQAGVLHRDVKPANILVTAFGEPALADFGIARVDGGQQTATGLVTASFAHAAPEVLQGKLPTAASDLYSLGSTMYELLTGSPAHFRPDDESAWALMNRVITEPMPDPALVGIGEPLAFTIRVATAHSPEQRFAGAEQFLASLSGDGGLTVAPSTPPTDPDATKPADPLPASHRRDQQPEATAVASGTDQLAAGDQSTMAMAAPFEPEAASNPGREGQSPMPTGDAARPRSRARLPLVAALAVVVIVAVGGAAFVLWLQGDPTPEPVVIAFPAGISGPLDAGTDYDFVADGGNESTTFVVLVDGEALGPEAPLPVVFTPEPGRSSVAVRATTGDVVETSDVFEIYAIGDLPPAGYRVNLASVTDDATLWASAIERYDLLSQAGHTELELLPSSRFAALTPGFWNLYVPGFGEDRTAAEEYCLSFGLDIPNECFVSRFDPSA